MLRRVREWMKQRQRRQIVWWMAQEIKGNLETYYVMRQLDQCRRMELLRYQESGCEEVCPWPMEVRDYIERIRAYDQAFDAAQEYERWYLQTIKHQNQENARRLHGLQEAVEERSAGLEDIMVRAQKALQEKLEKDR